MEQIPEIAKSMAVGMICGVTFGVFHLPVPAPPVISGIVGIFGIWLGYVMANRFFG